MQINWGDRNIIDESRNLVIEPKFALSKTVEFITDERKEKIEKVLSNRSSYFAPVMEHIYNRGNVSAVMRSAEALGFHNFHIIEKGKDFKKSKRVTQGADKWLDVKKWTKTADCLKSLKSEGYKIYATHLSTDAVPFDDLDFSQKTAVIFGNECDGVSEEALALADGNVILPMVGFTQSYNISVAGALSFQRAFLQNPPKIDEAERELFRALYYLKTITWPDVALQDVFGRS